MFDQASMLLCECFVHASALHLQLDSEFFPLFIRSIQVSVLGSSTCTRMQNLRCLSGVHVHTHTHILEEMHAAFHCHCIPHSEIRPCSTGVITRCQDKRYTATAVLTRTVDRAAVQRCMPSYQALEAKPGEVTEEQWRVHSTAAQTQRVDRAAVKRCMRSYPATAAQTRRVDRGAVQGSLCGK